MTNPADLARVREWMDSYPREGWALEELPADDPLRTRAVAAILQHRSHDDEAIDELARYADALEAHQQAEEAGKVMPAPPLKRCRQYKVQIVRMKHVANDQSACFRVDFVTDQGWSGFFDTTNPLVVEKINKHTGLAITLVGEVIERPYDFMVKLGGPVRIV